MHVCRFVIIGAYHDAGVGRYLQLDHQLEGEVGARLECQRPVVDNAACHECGEWASGGYRRVADHSRSGQDQAPSLDPPVPTSTACGEQDRVHVLLAGLSPVAPVEPALAGQLRQRLPPGEAGCLE